MQNQKQSAAGAPVVEHRRLSVTVFLHQKMYKVRFLGKRAWSGGRQVGSLIGKCPLTPFYSCYYSRHLIYAALLQSK